MADDELEVQSRILRLRGLPFDANSKSIVEFFEHIVPKDGDKGVHLTRDKYGRPSGEGYVEFESIEDAKAAMSFNKKHLGRRYIELFPSNESEMNFVVPRSGMNAPLREPVLRMRGLPFSADFAAIREFFQGYNIVKDGILLVYNDSGKFSGDAYVQFSSPDVAMRSMSRNKQNMGHRYIELFPSSMAEAYAEANRQQALQPMYPGDFSGPASYGDYEPLMGDYGGAMMGPPPPPPPSASRSSMRNHHHGARMGGSGGAGGPMGGRSSSSALSRPSPYQSAASGRRGGGGGYSGQPGSNWASTTGYWVHMRGLPYKVTEADILEFFAPLTPALIELHLNHEGLPSGEADVDFHTEADASNAMAKDKQHIGSRYIDLFLHKAHQDNYNNNSGIPSLMGSGFGRGLPPSAGPPPPPPSSRQGSGYRPAFGGGGGVGGSPYNRSSSYWAHLRGLPWAATEREIIEFFYPLQPLGVNLLKDRSGRSSGEADVQFANWEDQQQALNLDGQMMGNRYIEVFLR